jgi:hypothetical protein
MTPKYKLVVYGIADEFIDLFGQVPIQVLLFDAPPFLPGSVEIVVP